MLNDDELKVIDQMVDDLFSICEDSIFCPRENDDNVTCQFCMACSLYFLGYRKEKKD